MAYKFAAHPESLVKIRLDVQEKEMQIERGLTAHIMAFNGSIPGDTFLFVFLTTCISSNNFVVKNNL
jgi:hypothetical protein